MFPFLLTNYDERYGTVEHNLTNQKKNKPRNMKFINNSKLHLVEINGFTHFLVIFLESEL